MSQLRPFVEGVSFHVIHRGNNRQTMFGDDDDHRVFLAFLPTSCRKYELDVHSFALMKNHYHLIVTPQQEWSLARGLQSLGVRYVRYFNRKYERVGHLAGSRPREYLLADAQYWLNCLRYIEQNPVRAGIVSSPGEYLWSSYRVHAYGEACSWLKPHPVYLALGATDEERQAAYRRLAESPLTDEQLVQQRMDPGSS